VGVLGQRLPGVAPSLAILQAMMLYGVMVNLTLGIFNLLPLPPLDGSHVFKYLLPPAWSLQYQQLGRFGFLLLFAMISFLPSVLRAWMAPARMGFAVAQAVIGPFLLPSPLG
jgi:Zn-dependent protease